MKTMKNLAGLWIVLCLVWVGTLTGIGGQTCCVTAKAKGKDCDHKCCIDARKAGKTCEKCQKEATCCDKAIALGKECAHKCCIEATKAGKVCEKCNKPAPKQQ